MKKEFEITNYDPIWRENYSIEKRKLVKIFSENLNSIHHIGSTAIPIPENKNIVDLK